MQKPEPALRSSNLRHKASYAIPSVLNAFFPKPQIPLIYQDPYTLLVAVILSAQCPDARVNQVTAKLFKQAATPKEMIQLSIEEITALIRPCSLHKSRAKAIWNLSRILVEKYNASLCKTILPSKRTQARGLSDLLKAIDKRLKHAP